MVAGALHLEEVSTPVGTVQVAAGPAGLAWVRLPGASLPSQIVVAGVFAGEPVADPEGLAREAAGQVEEYFAGTRREFDLPLDLGALSDFQRAVLEAAAEIPYGETASYREMAISAGSPDAVRAAGTAMGANPVPLLIPCHRVIRSDGSPGLYGGGEPLKRWLLDFEAGGISRVGAESPRVARSG